jgi:carbon monoxide dehydrogenase subunit G
MKITNEFEVARPVDTVWEFFQDVPSVAQCLPGADLTEEKGNGVFAGSISVKLGPMSAMFEGEATVTPDPVAKSANISGKGVDRRGGSRGQVKVDYRLDGIDSGTRVTVDADVTLSGSAAQFGRSGLINEMSTRLIGDFVECLEKKLGAATAEEAAAVTAGEVKGISLFFASLASWIARFFKRLFGRE